MHLIVIILYHASYRVHPNLVRGFEASQSATSRYRSVGEVGWILLGYILELELL